MNRIRYAVAGTLFVACVALVAGCGDEAEYGEVSGTVTYEGKAIEDGGITFLPAKGPTAGDVFKNGKYSCRVAVGTAKVTITGSKVVGKKKMYNTKDSPEMPVTAEYLPAKYNSKTELTFEVKRGVNEKNWELTK